MKKLVSFKTLNAIYPGFPSEIDVQNQRKLYGLNEILENAPHGWKELLRDTFKDPMIWFLIVLSFIFLILHETREALTLGLALIPLILMDAFLHKRTEASMAGLKRQLKNKVVVIRSGQEKEVQSFEIVPGDLVKVKANDLLPADGVFEETQDILIDESALTGEALPILKNKISNNPYSIYQKGEGLVDLDVLGYAGTRVLRGDGALRITRTGKFTSYGEIVQSVLKVSNEKTSLQKSISRLVFVLSIFAGACCILLAIIRIYQGKGWLDAFISSATVAISAIPEEFPVVFTFFLGVGVFRLAKKKALVRKAVSVENIGRVTYICTDKTGTITRGQLKLTHIVVATGMTEKELLMSSAAASDPLGIDPVDQAIFEWALSHESPKIKRLKVFPFTEDKKNESVIVETSSGGCMLYVKGSPELILSKVNLDLQEKNRWVDKTFELAKEGHKVLACARFFFGENIIKELDIPSDGYEFLGLLAFEDPPRPEVSEAIKYCQDHHIKVLMMTGDHPETARAIAKEVGIGNGHPLVLSAESHPDQFKEEWIDYNLGFLKTLDVVARCNPIQKYNIVSKLKKSGEIVAVTGDGVNDVPALKNADIGISMGIRGTKSAKDVSSIIISDDNFSTIVHAIKEGKQLFYNLKLSFEYLLLIHIPFVLSAAIIPFMGLPLLFLPVHIVWVELIIHPTALFAFQLNDHAGVKVVFDEGKYFFSKKIFLISLVVGICFSLLLIKTFMSQDTFPLEVYQGRGNVLALLSLWSVGIVIIQTKLKTLASILVSFFTIILSVLMIQIPALSNRMELTPLSLNDWLINLLWIFSFLSFLYYLKRSRSFPLVFE